jgi:hypothetical protein
MAPGGGRIKNRNTDEVGPRDEARRKNTPSHPVRVAKSKPVVSRPGGTGRIEAVPVTLNRQFIGNRQQAGLPQGPASMGGQPPAIGSEPPLITGAAVVLNSLSSFRDPQEGQVGVSPLRTSSSASREQSSQRYSKSGMMSGKPIHKRA